MVRRHDRDIWLTPPSPGPPILLPNPQDPLPRKDFR